MDFKKIFVKDACPTKIGGQAVLEGVMMKGEDRTAVVVRTEKGRLHVRTEKLPPRSKAAEIPVIRGVYIFVTTLMTGMKTLMYSAEVLEKLMAEEETEDAVGDAGADDAKGKKEESALPFGVMIALSVVIAIAFVVGIFIIVPTVVVNFLHAYTDNAVVLNLVEGAFRIILFVVYIVVISHMKEIQTTFEYHGAEHQTIHCFENGLPLKPKEAAQFETLHPRCGTSFLMFVMIIALLVFSLLGWPDLVPRILSRIVFIPLIAGLSFELLRYAGSRDTPLVRALSVPGLMLQKLTTRVPDEKQLEVSIAALNAVLVPPEARDIEGYCDLEGRLIPEEKPLEIESVLAGLRELTAGLTTIGELIPAGEKTLREAGVESPENDAEVLFCFALGYDKAELFLNRASEVSEGRREAWNRFIARRAAGEPLQYITGEQYFMGHRFFVNPSVLIPRFETELLAEKAIEYLCGRSEGKRPPSLLEEEGGAKAILDLCTGSGALAVSIAMTCRDIEVTAADVSADALEVAKRNAEALGVSDRIDFTQSDLFSAFGANHGDGTFDRPNHANRGDGTFDRPKFDLIVTNPPYVRAGDLAGLAREIHSHEPAMALDGGTDGLAFYRRIASEAPRFMRPGACLMAEIGHDQGEAVSAIFTDAGFASVEISQDLNGLDRIITASKTL